MDWLNQYSHAETTVTVFFLVKYFLNEGSMKIKKTMFANKRSEIWALNVYQLFHKEMHGKTTSFLLYGGHLILNKAIWSNLF